MSEQPSNNNVADEQACNNNVADEQACGNVLAEQAINLSCKQFVSVLASKAPTPGGGGAAALVAAIAAALGNMVGSLTVGKEKYVQVQDDIIALNQRAKSLQDRLLELVDKDGKAFDSLMLAYSLSGENDQQKKEKADKIELALDDCYLTSLHIMQESYKVIELAAEYTKKGTRLAISDAGCCAIFANAALKAAALSAFANTKLMKDRNKALSANSEVEALLENSRMASKVYCDVINFLTDSNK
ncbi:MAG: cyclodeaminase/cyclohydrolase family protein [Coriobacteriales bacterium]|jgi:formiminotetrahydrofolate cyclodeaminase|nr:cyclodeaminase/cyclohydrolase family protein [Coriobacteriales bacterium]